MNSWRGKHGCSFAVATWLPELRTGHMTGGKQAPAASPMQLLAGGLLGLMVTLGGQATHASPRDGHNFHREPSLHMRRRPSWLIQTANKLGTIKVFLHLTAQHPWYVCRTARYSPRKPPQTTHPSPEPTPHKNPPAHYSADPAETDSEPPLCRLESVHQPRLMKRGCEAATLVSRSHEGVGITTPSSAEGVLSPSVPARIVH